MSFLRSLSRISTFVAWGGPIIEQNTAVDADLRLFRIPIP
jgi:hypothetical protein